MSTCTSRFHVERCREFRNVPLARYSRAVQVNPLRTAVLLLAAILNLHAIGTADPGGGQNEPSGQGGSSRAVLVRVNPEYPRIAAFMELIGVVQLEATVRPDGTVRKVRVLGGHPLLADAAQRAVMQWRFERESRETTERVRIAFRPQ